jgi:hypothetical protein
MSAPSRHRSPADSSAAVDAFMLALEHPHKPVIEALRACLLAVDPRVAEGIKWNAPSFRTHEYFATVKLREKSGLGLLLHLGAKARDAGHEVLLIDDTPGQLRWLGKDRAMLVFKDLQDFERRRAGFEVLMRSWIACV